MNKDLLQIPLEDRLLLNELMLRVWSSDDTKALSEAIGILNKYCKRGFYTTQYAIELLAYQESQQQIKLHEDLF